MRFAALLALCAALPAVILTGCGGVPGNAVAEVDGTAIVKQDFEHWMTVAARSSGQANAKVPVPPDYAECVAAARKAVPKPTKGQPKITDAQLKTQCKQQYEQLRDQVLGLLISVEWIDREATEQGVKVSDADVKKDIAAQKKQYYPKDADYQKFLKDSGQSAEDISLQSKFRLQRDKLVEKITKGKDKVSDAQVKTYYDKNKARFAQPEQRDLSVVLTKNKARADAAKAALDSGDSFKTVVKEYSIDDASKAQGGKLPGVAQGQQDRGFDRAIFGAEQGELTGPVKTQYGFYVFKVDKITKADQQSLAEAAPLIKQQLASENQQKALDDFAKGFRKRWKEKTDCREGYTTPDCKGEPEPTPTPTPQAGAPQQVPPPGGQ